ncbi:MAG: pyridoxal-phosphate dependent enzyme [Jaaginema sp. PMC 1079.18]|nr:pyridoxal-phosphate dependent enzyme [Jaaginema sp. PMC 1080.18]MEC4850984.1 pyridoxal-phosphate dependent enzyme [Jaaginema sp. PMC 1079.18]MEC4865119.1 pyridoxal-phosphate dependent enzyme [Jaaginema sp. PMC 1078.18]
MSHANIVEEPTFANVTAAQLRIQSYLQKTPIIESSKINRQFGTKVYFKCENLQTTGSFKFRGALNAVLSLPPEIRQKGIIAHSSGNHGIALAKVAQQLQIPCTIVVPYNAPLTKHQKIAANQANIVLCEPTLAAREASLKEVKVQTGAVEIHSSNHPHVIAGAGSVALEFLSEMPNLEVLITPVGGGGLLSGTGLVAAHQASPIDVFGAEPRGADDAYCSLKAGKIIRKSAQTVADGLRSALGNYTFEVIRQTVRDILLVEDDSIIESQRWLQEELGFTVEPSAAIVLGAIATYTNLFKDREVGVVLSGGNVD